MHLAGESLAESFLLFVVIVDGVFQVGKGMRGIDDLVLLHLARAA